MITAEEIIKEINETVTPFEFKANITSINHDFIKSIGKEYILAVNKKIGEIAKILKKYGIFIIINFNTDIDDAILSLWFNYEDTQNEDIDDLNNLIDRLTDALYKPSNLNIDYELLNIALKDKSIHKLDYISIN